MNWRKFEKTFKLNKLRLFNLESFNLNLIQLIGGIQ